MALEVLYDIEKCQIVSEYGNLWQERSRHPMLTGEYKHNIDAKGRLTIPSKFREQLGEQFVITKGTDRCLLIFPMDQWKLLEEELQKLPRSRDARDYIRHVAGSAETEEFDSMGRANVAPALREYAGLKKETVLIGVLDRIEIWDKASWDERENRVCENIEMITENLAALGFNI